MSYRLATTDRSRKKGRFIAKVHQEVQDAFVRSGMKQIDLSRKLGVDRSAVNKQLTGESNLTLKSLTDLAWAMDCDIVFSMQESVVEDRNNFFVVQPLNSSNGDTLRMSGSSATGGGEKVLTLTPTDSPSRTASVKRF